ncbi:uncharacterized protein B0J16DRAFT_402243, partial [Fusarium flagelliforme]|uniref:uncharacterized protein n=1 Tax=Fusarium flagelliforme TaxID=2675880 RepID=UPI001E8D852D
SNVSKGGHVVINGQACKINQVSKRGEKLHIIGSDLFTGKKQELSVMPGEHVDIPSVKRNQYQFLYIDDDVLHLLESNGSEKNDIPVLKREVGNKTREFEESGMDAFVTVISAMGQEVAVAVKQAPTY